MSGSVGARSGQGLSGGLHWRIVVFRMACGTKAPWPVVQPYLNESLCPSLFSQFVLQFEIATGGSRRKRKKCTLVPPQPSMNVRPPIIVELNASHQGRQHTIALESLKCNEFEDPARNEDRRCGTCQSPATTALSRFPADNPETFRNSIAVHASFRNQTRSCNEVAEQPFAAIHEAFNCLR